MSKLDQFSTGLMITKASRLVQQMYQKELSQYSVTPPQSAILWILSRSTEVSQTDVVRALMLDKANVSALVRKLKEQNLIKVSQSQSDGRKTLLSLTSRGRELVKKIDRIDKKINTGIEKSASREELKKTRDFLNTLLELAV